jgi:hypothetical protein
MYTTSDKSMGKVLTTLTVTSRTNQSAAARGLLCLPEGAIAIPSKTQQPIALCFYCSFSTKRDRSSTDSILPQFQIHPFAMYTAMPPVILIHNLLK